VECGFHFLAVSKLTNIGRKSIQNICNLGHIGIKYTWCCSLWHTVWTAAF